MTAPACYSDQQILEYMEKGDIVIDPFNRANLGTSSYDLTLGEFYYIEQRPRLFENLYNIYDFDEVQRVWGTEAMRARAAWEVFGQHKKQCNIRDHERVILLAPGETILAHTDEFIGGRNHITAMMKARSSMGRSFIEVCKCAGWGDVGYINRWTMEITNNSLHYNIPLVVGRRIAQMIFFETGPIIGADYSATGKYQTSNDISTIRNSWHPSALLPRLYKDKDINK